MKLQILFLTISLQLIRFSLADPCPNDPPVWVAALDSIIPILGILVSFSYFFTVRCCSDKHIKYLLKLLRGISFLNWIIFWVSVVFFVLSCTNVRKKFFSGLENTEWVFGAAMIVSWLVMMAESYVCREKWYIKRLRKERPVFSRIEKIWTTQPTVTWSVVGYTFENREVPVGSLRLSCSTPKVPLSDSKEYVYKYWTDHSEDTVTGGGRKLVTRIRLNQEIQAGDADTRQHMEDQKQAWKDSFNQRRETSVDFMETMSVRGFQKRMAIDQSISCCARAKLCCEGCSGTYLKECCVQCNGCDHCCLCLRECCTPLVIGKAQFWISAFIGLTWPYRWLFECLTDKTKLTIKKSFYKDEPTNIQGYRIRKYGEIIKEIQHIHREIDPDPIALSAVNVQQVKAEGRAVGQPIEERAMEGIPVARAAAEEEGETSFSSKGNSGNENAAFENVKCGKGSRGK